MKSVRRSSSNGERCLFIATVLFFEGAKFPKIIRGHLTTTPGEAADMLERWYEAVTKRLEVTRRNLSMTLRRWPEGFVDPEDYADAEDIAEFLGSCEDEQDWFLSDPVFAALDTAMEAFSLSDSD